jgi:hypothetical protein
MLASQIWNFFVLCDAVDTMTWSAACDLNGRNQLLRERWREVDPSR